MSIQNDSHAKMGVREKSGIYYCLTHSKKRRHNRNFRNDKNNITWRIYYSESEISTTLDVKPDEVYIKEEQQLCCDSSKRSTLVSQLSQNETCEAINGSIANDESFYVFFQEFLCMKQARICSSTLELYYVELAKMKRFREELTFSEVTLDFIIQYENYMLTKLGNKRNTVSKSLRKIKTVIRFAILKGLMKKDPFAGYTLMNERSDRQHLNEQELLSMCNLLKLNLSLHEKTVLRGFIFSCYTGLRFQDIIKLKPTDIKDGMIEIKQQKTKEIISIPIINRAIPLLEIAFDGLFFPLHRNDVANRYLKLLCLRAGIKKHVTFHVARHTFATLSLNKGIPIEVVSSLLGHNNIQTTQVYAKIVDVTKRKMMERWNE